MQLDAFEVYPCMVDGSPASIYVNLRYEVDAPPAASTRYDVAFAIGDPGSHGIGDEAEGIALDALEQALIARAVDLGLVYVGRVRGRGVWESTFHGAPGHAPALRAITSELVADRRAVVKDAADPAWRYYREVLLPDAERRRWIEDRRIVQILAEHGDSLRTPRRVDHRLADPSEAFVAAARRAGFERDGDVVFRDDPVELDHIHDVVMELVDLAAEHGGTYERWTAAITR